MSIDQGQMTCPVGCLVCGHQYWATEYHSGQCCGASICDEGAWRYTQLQMGNWYEAETKWKEQVTVWLAAEENWTSVVQVAQRKKEADAALREELRSKGRVRVRHVTREDQREASPHNQRAVAPRRSR